jgi:hypothetical protein
MTSIAPRPTAEERFKKTVIELSHLIHDLVKNVHDRGYEVVNPSLVGLVSGFLSSYDATKLIRNFILYSYPHWDQISLREMKFFDENAADIFRDLPMKNVNSFKMLYSLNDKEGNPVVCEEDREAVWEFFDALIKISIQYIHSQRRPAMKTDTAGTRKMVYTYEFCKEVDLSRQAEKWKVNLTV